MRKAPEANGDLGIVLNRNNSNPSELTSPAHPLQNAHFKQFQHIQVPGKPHQSPINNVI